ncbi:MAG: BrnT family toxin [Deinococcota bacterium]|jgi:uncharacterized DUF497 family protein|nr:BrnT family toxin [Deinococcota bacterium]
MDFEWDDGNIDHIANHDVEPFEAEEAITDPRRVPFPAHSGNIGFIGKTEDGRYLVVISQRKGKSLWRVATARDAKPGEKKSYRRNR